MLTRAFPGGPHHGCGGCQFHRATTSHPPPREASPPLVGGSPGWVHLSLLLQSGSSGFRVGTDCEKSHVRAPDGSGWVPRGAHASPFPHRLLRRCGINRDIAPCGVLFPRPPFPPAGRVPWALPFALTRFRGSSLFSLPALLPVCRCTPPVHTMAPSALPSHGVPSGFIGVDAVGRGEVGCGARGSLSLPPLSCTGPHWVVKGTVCLLSFSMAYPRW